MSQYVHVTDGNSKAFLTTMVKEGLKNVFLPLFVFHAHSSTHKQKHKQPASDTHLIHNVPHIYFCLQDKGFYFLLQDDKVCVGVWVCVCGVTV